MMDLGTRRGPNEATFARCRAMRQLLEAADVGKREQVGHDRLAAAVFVAAIGMQAVAAAAGFRHRPAAATDRSSPKNQAKAR